ncbi:dephospho-CoA kinase [Thalassolituus sp.]|jgi:dephospho-CoA kinase|uniref:dephospho-CoA kinase n=1 Tax=Thalassolituus sp. TaxID=2030822 RepID=UPI002A7FAC02|nr:dephospho-CoA kinase [Thalassolituus sp.]
MLVVGLTGGIGSGKTAASDYFASLGIAVVDADVVAREVVEPNQPAWQAILERYGKQAFLSDQSLDRAWLRGKVFSDPNERIWLEQQTHPRIRERLIQQLQSANSAYAILVSPLLFESGQSALVQRTLLVDVPTDIQVARASSRDGNDEEHIRRIIAAQMSREDRCAKATDIVDNSADLGSLYQQLEPLHQHYLELAKAS